MNDIFTLSDLVSTDERYDLAKLMEFKGDTYDVLISPFLMGLKQLPVWRYYKCANGAKDIDMISYDAYGTLFFAYLIQYYNDTLEEVFDEETVLKLFNVEDLEELYAKVSDGNLAEIV